MNRLMKFLETDFLSLALAKFREIPKVYVRSFVIIFLAINAAFAYHTFYFMWGDHDWGRIIINSPKLFFTSYGRFSAFLHFSLLTGNNILPVLTNLYAFAALAFSSVLLCIYWKVPKSTLYYSIIGILLYTQPYTLTWLSYAHLSLTQYGLPFLVISALIFSERSALCDKRWRIIAYLCSAIFLNTLAFGTYMPVLNTLAVVFIGRLIVDVFRGEGGIFVVVKGILFRQRYTFLTIALGALFFEAIFLILKNNGFIDTTYYSLQTVGIKNFIPHLMSISYKAFRILWHYPVTFFPNVLVRLWTSLFIFGVFSVIVNVFVGGGGQCDRKTRIIKSVSLLALFLLIVIFSKTAAIIATHSSTIYEPRILFFGDPFLHVFPIALIFIQRFNFPKTIAILISIVLLNICLIYDAKALKVWKFDFEAQKMLWNRVMTRIEGNENYDASKKYELLFVGDAPSYDIHYYGNNNRRNKENEFKRDSGISKFNTGILRSHSRAFYFFFPDLFARNYRELSWLLKQNKKSRYYEQAQSIKKTALKLKTQINDMRAYPHKNSVLIKDDVIIIVFSESELNEVKKILNK
ncbi:MAG: glucosyltransferase domain-containing protein [Rickettsiales bacterium]|jgi:hypothetical protein|nr:glucosyltransferase domain-containing protein [Rickettsiales bacterium]